MPTNTDRGHHGRPWRRIRAQVLRQSTTCWVCHQPGATTVDHITPVSIGGAPLDPNNLRPCHASCNGMRGNGRRNTMKSRQW